MSLSTYTLAELLRKWQREELTVEQMLGHLLQHLHDIEQRLRQLEKPVSSEQ
jgi:hypothetical protein